MTYAESYIGLKEFKGGENEIILEFFRKVGHPEVKEDEVPWCSAFAGACLVMAGYDGTKSLMARSWLNWKKAETIHSPRFGDICIFSRGSGKVYGHVAFFVKWDNDYIYCLGGNQANSVSVTKISREKLLGFRRPVLVGTAPPPKKDSLVVPAAIPVGVGLVSYLEPQVLWLAILTGLAVYLVWRAQRR
jgi:uncharacterized protein (TIGR02594 family)